MRYVVWDVETTIHTSFKRKGNPFDPRNFVVMSGYKHHDDKAPHGDYFGTKPKPSDWFTKMLRYGPATGKFGVSVVVGQNIKFDLLCAFLDKEHGKANHALWMKYVAQGGYLWDIQLGEYLLEGMVQASHMLALDELAPKYGGSVKIDEVKALWEAGVNTTEIDPQLLRDYLCGRRDGSGYVYDHGDIGNTELVFLAQYQRAVESKQAKSILLNMGSLMCTVEMELNGMAVDKAEGERQAAVLAEKLAVLSVELAAYLPADLPFDFNWGSGTQKSALIFGGAVKYALRMPILKEDGSQAYAQRTVRKPILDEDGCVVLYASGKNAGEIKYRNVTEDDPDKPKSRMEDFIYDFPGFTKPSAAWKGKQTDARDVPIYGTSGEVIEALGNRDIPFLDALTEVIGLRKDLTTYYIVTDPETGEQSGMLTLVQADGIIHHMLNHTSTVTARFSSSNPNLQNLPKEGKSTVKTLFVSRFKGGKIIQSDFTALEVYCQAILTKCKRLILDLLEGLDMHCSRVATKEGISYEEALRLCVTEAVPEWKKKRGHAKVFSFQRAYGAGKQKIHDSTGIPIEDVEALIAAENERYPEVERFYDNLKDRIKTTSIPTTRVLEHPEIPGLKCYLRKSYYKTPDGKLYAYSEHPAPKFLAEKPASKGGMASSFSPTEIKNYIVQGTGGEWAKAAMWLAIRAYYKRENFGGLALLVNQVHDALYADADNSVAIEAAAVLEASMLAASEFMEWYFKWEIPVPVPSATNIGDNMMDEGKMPEGFSDRVAVIRQELRAEYMAGYVPSFDVLLQAA